MGNHGQSFTVTEVVVFGCDVSCDRVISVSRVAGDCDNMTGRCTCLTGFKGQDCSIKDVPQLILKL